MKTTVVSPDLTVSYEEAGEGIPLVFLHAFPLNASMWKGQIEHFSNEYHVLAPNFRGLGKTSPFRSTPSIQTLASDLATWLEEIDVYDAVILCGLSMGGYVALEFARTYPEKLRGLILADTRAEADTAEGKKARNEMIAFANKTGGSAVALKMEDKLIGKTTRLASPRLIRKVKDLALPNDGRSLGQLVAAMRDRRDSTPALKEITCPTLVIGGEEDVVTPPDVLAVMSREIPQARQEIIANAGHLSNLEEPEAFNAALRKFLGEIR